MYKKGDFQYHNFIIEVGNANRFLTMVEMTQKHLINANWNIKESTTIIKEYLALYKYAVPIREEI